jgi:hypothetical protein
MVPFLRPTSSKAFLRAVATSAFHGCSFLISVALCKITFSQSGSERLRQNSRQPAMRAQRLIAGMLLRGTMSPTSPVGANSPVRHLVRNHRDFRVAIEHPRFSTPGSGYINGSTMVAGASDRLRHRITPGR